LIHIATPIMSTRSFGTRYTAQGLGDRIHLITLAHQCSITLNEKVQLHLCGNHLGRNKQESFKEILDIFANSNLKLVCHEGEFQNDLDWLNFLNGLKIDAVQISYPDHPGWLEINTGLNIPELLKDRALISPMCFKHSPNLEVKYIVSQWDGSGPSRKISKHLIQRILNRYSDMGLTNLVVGGEALTSNFRDCLSCIGMAIARAEYFVGIDSGFMHFAMQILPYKKIHIYNSYKNYWSHHLLRARDMGVQINPFIISNNPLKKLYVKLRFDSLLIAKINHKMKGTKNYKI